MTVDKSGKITDSAGMNGIDQLLLIAETYREAGNLSDSTVSWRALGDTRKLVSLKNGNDIQVKRLEAAMQWFSDNWPRGTKWPNSVYRPSKVEVAA